MDWLSSFHNALWWSRWLDQCANGYGPDSYAVDPWDKRRGRLGVRTVGRLESAQLFAERVVRSGAATHCFVGRRNNPIPYQLRRDGYWAQSVGCFDADGWREYTGGTELWIEPEGPREQ